MSIEVRVLRTFAELYELTHVWESWPGHRDSQIDFFTTVLRGHEQAVSPCVFVIYRDGQPKAMLVGRIDYGPLFFPLAYFHFRPKARTLYLVYGALRGEDSEENCRLFLTEIQAMLRRGEADIAYLNYLKSGSILFRVATTQPSLLARDHIRDKQPHFAATLPTSVPAFYARLSSKARWQAKNKQKKLEREFAGSVDIRCFTEPGEVELLLAETERVAKTSYQRGLGIGFFDNPDNRMRWALKAEKHWLRGYILYLRGQPCAFWTADIIEGTFRSEFLGFDPAFEKHSPGNYLIFKVIESLCDDPTHSIQEIDFTTGSAQYKEMLSNASWNEELVYVFSKSPKGMMLAFLRLFTIGADHVLKSLLARTDLLKKIKKMWRSRATDGRVQVAKSPNSRAEAA